MVRTMERPHPERNSQALSRADQPGAHTCHLPGDPPVFVEPCCVPSPLLTPSSGRSATQVNSYFGAAKRP